MVGQIRPWGQVIVGGTVHCPYPAFHLRSVFPECASVSTSVHRCVRLRVRPKVHLRASVSVSPCKRVPVCVQRCL